MASAPIPLPDFRAAPAPSSSTDSIPLPGWKGSAGTPEGDEEGPRVVNVKMSLDHVLSAFGHAVKGAIAGAPDFLAGAAQAAMDIGIEGIADIPGSIAGVTDALETMAVVPGSLSQRFRAGIAVGLKGEQAFTQGAQKLIPRVPGSSGTPGIAAQKIVNAPFKAIGAGFNKAGQELRKAGLPASVVSGGGLLLRAVTALGLPKVGYDAIAGKLTKSAQGADAGVSGMSAAEGLKAAGRVASASWDDVPMSTPEQVADAAKIADNRTLAMRIFLKPTMDARVLMTPKDIMALSDHVDDTSVPLTDAQRKIKDTVLTPLLQHHADLMTLIHGKKYPVPDDPNPTAIYVPRVYTTKPGSLAKQLNAVVEDGPAYAGISGTKTSASEGTLHRSVYKLTDPAGNERIATIKAANGGRAYVWEDGHSDPVPLGVVHLAAKDDMAGAALHPLQQRMNELDARIDSLRGLSGAPLFNELASVEGSLRDLDEGSSLDQAAGSFTARLAELQKHEQDLQAAAGKGSKLEARLDSVRKEKEQLNEAMTAFRALREDGDSLLDPDAIRAATHDAKATESVLASVREPSVAVQVLNRVRKRIAAINTQLQRHGVTAAESDDLMHQRQVLASQQDVLRRATRYFNPARRVIAAHLKQRDALETKLAEVQQQYAQDHLDDANAVLRTRDGTLYKVGPAKVAEINAATGWGALTDPITATMSRIAELQSYLPKMQFVEALKKSPIAERAMISPERVASGAPVPDGFIRTLHPALNGWKLDPRLAYVLDDLAPKSGLMHDALTSVSNFMISMMFLNPLPHMDNGAMNFMVERGLWNNIKSTAWLPEMRRTMQTTHAAISDVVNKSPLYMEVLAKGGSFMSPDFQTGNFLHTMMAPYIRDFASSPLVARTGEQLGMKAADAMRAYVHGSQSVLWNATDAIMMQAIREKLAAGMSLDRAIHETEQVIPNYRIPAQLFQKRMPSADTVAGRTVNTMSRQLALFLHNPIFNVFGHYRYGLVKGYLNIMHNVIAGDDLHTRWRALNQIGNLAFLHFIGYPMLDAVTQNLLGNPNASVRRQGYTNSFGYFVDVFTKHQDIGAAVESLFGVTTGLQAYIGITQNRNIYTGEPIINPYSSALRQAEQGLSFAAESIPIYGLNGRVFSEGISGKSLGEMGLGLMDIKDPDRREVERRLRYQAEEKRRMMRAAARDAARNR